MTHLLSLPGMVNQFIASPGSVLHQLSYQVPSLTRLSFSANKRIYKTHTSKTLEVPRHGIGSWPPYLAPPGGLGFLC